MEYSVYVCVRYVPQHSIFLLQDSEKCASASIESDEPSKQEEITLDSVHFITKRHGKENKITRKKNSNEETNASGENTGLSDEKEVICIAWFCVLSTRLPPCMI